MRVDLKGVMDGYGRCLVSWGVWVVNGKDGDKYKKVWPEGIKEVEHSKLCASGREG